MTQTYKVLSVDSVTRTMIVEFTQDGLVLALNVPVPRDSETIAGVATQYWPTAEFTRLASTTAHVDTATAAIGQAQTYAAPTPPPAPVPTIDARLWLERLSGAKQLAITAAGLANPSLMLWLLKAAGAQTGIILSDPDTIAGVQALVTAGIITTADQTLLMTP